MACCFVLRVQSAFIAAVASHQFDPIAAPLVPTEASAMFKRRVGGQTGMLLGKQNHEQRQQQQQNLESPLLGEDHSSPEPLELKGVPRVSATVQRSSHAAFASSRSNRGANAVLARKTRLLTINALVGVVLMMASLRVCWDGSTCVPNGEMEL